MKWAVVALNYRSIEEAKKLRGSFKGYDIKIYTIEKYLEDGLLPLSGGLRRYNEVLFKEYKVIIYVMAMGIIVRDIAPYLKHKSVDPAVLCLSVDGSYVIPVLSGHLGGANELAFEISENHGAVAVITTASDVLGKSAVDVIAKANDLVITSFKAAKDLTAQIINNEKVVILTDQESNFDYKGDMAIVDEVPDDAQGIIYVGYNKKIASTLPVARLIQKRLVIGIGARRDTPYLKIDAFLKEIFEEKNLDLKAIKAIASIDIKADEQGIIDLSDKMKVPFMTYSAEDLSKVADRFDQSEFVKSITGVGAVAMPSGCLASNDGACIVEKVAKDGMTLCIWSAT